MSFSVRAKHGFVADHRLMEEWLLTSNWLLLGSGEEIRPAVGTSHGRATLGPSVAVALLVSRHASCVFICTGAWCRWGTNDEGSPDPVQLLDREAGASKSTCVPHQMCWSRLDGDSRSPGWKWQAPPVGGEGELLPSSPVLPLCLWPSS